MIANRIFRSALHERADPAQRAVGASELAPDSPELARMLTDDPVPEVRAAAARRCRIVGALAVAWEGESDPAVRVALATSLSDALAETPDEAGARAFLGADPCSDAIRADVVRRARDADRRRIAIEALRDEGTLVEVALTAEHSETRMGAALRVHSPEGLRRLADAARNRDHGVARLARKRIDAIADREGQAAEADAVLAQLEALADRSGPILTAVIELNRRWQALDLRDDPARIARGEAARQNLQTRFDREHEEQRTRARFERRLSEWTARREAPETLEGIAALRAELAALRDEAAQFDDRPAGTRLDEAERRIEIWMQEQKARADAEVLVAEAEQLAGSTSIDDAKLPARWQALDRAIRTPALTRRFEAALIVVEQRRLAQIRAAEQEASAARRHVHELLHTAEQALAAGQLQGARAAADEIKARKIGAGMLPKPTMQRIGRLMQQLVELERWESFGQQHARLQLCERAEAAASATVNDPSQLAIEVQKLRDEWKALDKLHAGVPKALWERFDRACEKAYAPAARHFAEMAAQRKEARRRREEYVDAAAAHAVTLLAEPRDWRAIEHWMRETDRSWREGDLGSVEPRTWKSLDARLKAALAPLRDALFAARDQARAGRQALIDEVTALAGKATERGAPGQVKAIQARWQAQAKELPLAQRDERALWEKFRAACDAVFAARQARRKHEDGQKHEQRRVLEEICVQLERLAVATDGDERETRRGLRQLQEQWKLRGGGPDPALRGGGPDPALRGVDSRYRAARAAVESMLAARTRSREAAVWQTLAAKELLCEDLDRQVLASGNAEAGAAVAAASARWATLPALPPDWEKRMAARRDGAMHALGVDGAAAAHAQRIARNKETRREMLLGLEMALGLDSPAELQAQRLALQVRLLRERFQSASASAAVTTAERLLAWCAEPGVLDEGDRQRRERVFSAIERVR